MSTNNIESRDHKLKILNEGPVQFFKLSLFDLCLGIANKGITAFAAPSCQLAFFFSPCMPLNFSTATFSVELKVTWQLIGRLNKLQPCVWSKYLEPDSQIFLWLSLPVVLQVKRPVSAIN